MIEGARTHRIKRVKGKGSEVDMGMGLQMNSANKCNEFIYRWSLLISFLHQPMTVSSSYSGRAYWRSRALGQAYQASSLSWSLSMSLP